MSQSNQNKKLLILLDKDFVGGAEVNYRYIIPELEKRNYEVFLVLDGEENIKRYYRGFGINATLLPILSPYKPFSNSGKMCYINIAMTYFSLLRNRRILEKVASEYRPKAIISNSMISHWLLALWSNKRSYKASVVTIMHLQDIVDRTKVYGLYGVGLDWITSKVDKVVTISNSVTNTLSTEFHRKVKKLYNPVVNAELPTKRDKSEFLRVGMFARYTPWKGHKDLLRIAKYCSDGGIKFRCFGNVSDEEEAYYEELRAEAKALGDKITLNRFTPEVIKEMVNCDLILHLSVLPEPFGRILIEANVCKVPVFAYKGGAVEELYKELGLAGKLFENRDWESVAKAIISFDRRDYTFPDLSILNPSIYVDRLLSLIEESQ